MAYFGITPFSTVQVVATFKSVTLACAFREICDYIEENTKHGTNRTA